MTVKELNELLQKEDPDALVYTMAHDDDIALIVTKVKQDILAGSDKTIVLIY